MLHVDWSRPASRADARLAAEADGSREEREIRFTVFSDASGSLGRTVLLNLMFSLPYLAVSLSSLANWLTLVDRAAAGA